MTHDEVRARAAEAEAAKARFLTTLHTVQHRLSPKTIANDVKEGVKDRAGDAATKSLALANQGVAQARAKPVTIAAVAVPIAVFLLRKPIARALAAARRRGKPREALAASGDLTPYEAARVPTTPAGTRSTDAGTADRPQLAEQGA